MTLLRKSMVLTLGGGFGSPSARNPTKSYQNLTNTCVIDLFLGDRFCLILDRFCKISARKGTPKKDLIILLPHKNNVFTT